jgi:predicted  nucleic acid-binding Zn-ribbon protein
MTGSETRSHDVSADLSKDYSDALKREKKLKSRIQELVLALENLSRNYSEIRNSVDC